MGNWKDAGRRAFVGQPVTLKTISSPGEEFQIAPRKYSQQTADEMRELRVAFLRKGSNRERIREYEEIVKRLAEDKKTVIDAGPEDAERLNSIFAEVEMDPAYQTKLCELALLGGVGWHNFEEEPGKPICGGDHFDHVTVSHLLSRMAPTAMEAFAIIDGFNSPLPQGSAPTSETPPSGSSAEPSLLPASHSPTSTEPPASASPQK